jgi:hypothetical protein
MTDRQATRAASLEQDLLWSVLDQDSVPNILAMASHNWKAASPAAWAALLQAEAFGRLRAYRGEGPFTTVDLTQVPLEMAAHDHELFVEPTEKTHARLNDISKETVRS